MPRAASVSVSPFSVGDVQARGPVLEVLRGGRNSVGVVTVTQEAWDNLIAELRSSRRERREFAAVAFAFSRGVQAEAARLQERLGTAGLVGGMGHDFEKVALQEMTRARNVAVEGVAE